MFVYTVYGNPDPIRTPPRRVERVAAVAPTKRVNPSWRAQHGNTGQPQRTYAMQQAQRAYVASAQPPQATGADVLEAVSRTAPAFTSEISSMELRNTQPMLLEQRGAAAQSRDGAYIRKYVQSLNEARDRTIRQNRQSAELPRQDYSGAQNVLTNV